MEAVTEKTEIKPVRAATLELADLCDNICKRHNIKYTLLTYALWGAEEYKGFAPWSGGMQISMFYSEFRRFIEIAKSELAGTQYYIIDSDNCEQFEDVNVRLAKKGRVRLPENRKKDEIYYDYYIDIVPIFYAGNTKREQKALYKKCIYLKKRINAFKPLPGSIRLSNLFRMLKRNYYYRQRTPDIFDRYRKTISKYGDKPTKYILLPHTVKQDRIVCLADTYRNLKTVDFEGHKYLAIENSKQWVLEFYGEKKMEEIRQKPVNQAMLEGPEIIRRVQLIEIEMLKEVDRICRANNLRYIIAFGTLLGAYRHKGFIPWDDDIDVNMPYEDFLKFCEIAPKQMDTEKFFLRTQETDRDCNLVFATVKRNGTVYCKPGRTKYKTHPGVPIDIFLCFNGSNSWLLNKLQYRICKFLRTIIWSHMGAESEKKPLKRWYYTQLAKISNKKAYSWFIKVATIVKKKTDKFICPTVFRTPFNKAYTKQSSIDDRIEMEFEGHMFYAPKDYMEVLEFTYSTDFMRFPAPGKRISIHLPGNIDIGDLYKFE